MYSRTSSHRGYGADPAKGLRTDNVPEFLDETFTQWTKANDMAIQYIQPGKPNQNAYIERFNRTYREEVLGQFLFARLDDVRAATGVILVSRESAQ